MASPWQRLAPVSCTIYTQVATDGNGTQDPTWTQQPAAGSVVCVNRRKSHSHEHPFHSTSECGIPSPLKCNATALQSCNVHSLERYNPLRSGNCYGLSIPARQLNFTSLSPILWRVYQERSSRIYRSSPLPIPCNGD